MRRTVQIAGQIENLFGTLDENLKLFESALHVTTYLQNDRLAIEGDPAQVDRAVTILDASTTICGAREAAPWMTAP